MKNNKINEVYYGEIIGIPYSYNNENFNISEYLNKDVILEDKHKEVNIGQQAIGYLKANLKYEITLIDNNILKEKILPSWKYYDDFCINCMNINLYLLNTNFNNPKIAAHEIVKIGNESFNDILTKLALSMRKTYGLSFKANENAFVILMNDEYYKDDRKIQHEFTHYVQIVTGKLILNNDIKDNVKKYFNLNNENIKYILHPMEFWTNIFNDLFNGLQKIYWLKFKDVYSWDQFIDSQIKNINFKTFESSLIKKLWVKYVGNSSIYIDILAALSYIKYDFFNEICEKLKNK